MERKHNIVYVTTNSVNGKIYIGCHVTDNLDDGYLGSGRLFVRALAKHGKENFTREILFDFSTRAEMYAKEKELVTREFVAEETNYNLGIGGKGGFDWQTPEYRAWLGSIGGFATMPKDQRRNFSIKAGKSVKNRYTQGFVGKQHTEETKLMMSEKLKVTSTGKRNSQFGTMWITDGTTNRKIPKTADMPEGWRKGRV